MGLARRSAFAAGIAAASSYPVGSWGGILLAVYGVRTVQDHTQPKADAAGRSDRRRLAWAALVVSSLLISTIIASDSLRATGTEQRGPSGHAAGSVFESDFDGIWVGIIDAKTSSGLRPYPVLLNLEVRDTGGGGLLLLADDLHGNPSQLDFLELGIQIKGKKLTLSAMRGEEEAEEQLTAKLRIKGAALKGTIVSSDKAFSKSRVELRRLDPEEPLQQLWSGSLPSARGLAEHVALTLWIGKKIEGSGFVGSAFGKLANAAINQGRLTGTLKTPQGNIDIDLMIGKDGQLGGSVDGRPLGKSPLAPGATSATPTIKKLKPSSLPAGVTTEVAISGKNLAPGFLLRTDIPGVYAGVPRVLSAKKATVDLTVAADVAPGTPVQLTVAAANGEVVATKARLATGGVAEVSFLDDLMPILAGTCGVEGCHAQPPLDDPAYPDGEAAGGLVMDSVIAFANLVNVPSTERPELDRIEPFDPERSYLIKKLRGDADILGGRMPQDGPPYLSPEMIDMFIRWVEAGALRQ